MELPAVVIFLAVYLNGKATLHIVPLLFLVMWQTHYLNRTFIYPFRIRANGRKTPYFEGAKPFLLPDQITYIGLYVE